MAALAEATWGVYPRFTFERESVSATFLGGRVSPWTHLSCQDQPMAHATETDTAAGGRRTSRRARSRRRWIVPAIIVVVLLLTGAAIMLAIQGLKARTTLTSAIPLVEQVEDGIRNGETESAQRAVAELKESTQEARDAATGPLWSIAGIIPWVGPNVSAVSTTVTVIDDITHDVLEPMVAAAESLDYSKLGPVDGRIDLEPLASVEPSVRAASVAFTEAQASMTEIDTERLVDQIAGPVGEIQEYLEALGPTVHTGARAARLLPPMLGADEPRTYLVLFQNTAEMRATGGIAGAFAIIRAEGGQLDIVHQGTAGELGLQYEEPVLALDPGKEAIYTQRLGRFFTGVNLSPDFPTAARLASEMARQAGFEVDGVVATDPVALSYLLDTTGPVSVPGGELAADNAVPTLLSDVYWEVDDPEQQDSFFAVTAVTVFEALTGGAGEPVELINALGAAADERRLLMWSSREDEQRELHGTVLSGAFDNSAPSASALGVFFNDGTSAKMQYYLDTEVTHLETVCVDAARYDTLEVTLTSTAPPEAADEFPSDVTGVGNTGVPTGSVRTNVYFYGGVDGEIREVRRDGTPIDSEPYADGDRPVRVFTTELAPGESVTFEVQMSQSDRAEPVDVWSTPTVGESGHRATLPECG